MENLTQQMLDEFKPFIKSEKWEDHKKSKLDYIAKHGPIVNILDIYSVDGKYLLERRYQTERELGTDMGIVLMAIKIGKPNLNHLLTTEEDKQRTEKLKEQLRQLIEQENPKVMTLPLYNLLRENLHQNHASPELIQTLDSVGRLLIQV